jgi:hypothetical protein
MVSAVYYIPSPSRMVCYYVHLVCFHRLEDAFKVIGSDFGRKRIVVFIWAECVFEHPLVMVRGYRLSPLAAVCRLESPVNRGVYREVNGDSSPAEPT